MYTGTAAAVTGASEGLDDAMMDGLRLGLWKGHGDGPDEGKT
jgi:hypothetical protein